MQKCLNCEQQVKRKVAIYCSNGCQQDYAYKRYITRWKAGEVDGSRGIHAKDVSHHIRRYLLEVNQFKCSLCKWSERNVFTGRVPVEIDHIDGNADNNHVSNLRILCPNCHSLTANFRNLNKGKGRGWRKFKYLKNQ